MSAFTKNNVFILMLTSSGTQDMENACRMSFDLRRGMSRKSMDTTETIFKVKMKHASPAFDGLVWFNEKEIITEITKDAPTIGKWFNQSGNV